MMKSLNKRVFRDLKRNIVRYGALFVLLAVGLGVLVGMASSVDSIVMSNGDFNVDSNIEDGSFTMMMPLSIEQVNKLESQGVTIEETFYIDREAEDGSVLRLFKIRKMINKLHLTEGSEAADCSQVILEKLYAKEKGLHSADRITIDGKSYNISGIGCVPDYNFLIRNITDVAKDIRKFSVAFVSGDEFERICSVYPEEIIYNYSYKLGNLMTNNKLKHDLDEFIFDRGQISNIYVQELIDKSEKNINNLTAALDELNDGSKELYEKISEYKIPSELIDGASNLNEGVSSLSEALSTISQLPDELKEQASSLSAGSQELYNNIFDFKTPLELLDGARELNDGIKELSNEVNDYIVNEIDIKYSNLNSFIEKGDNTRINNCVDDAKINKSAAFVVGLFFLVLVAYILSIFSVQSIERERSVIGTLYSLGYQRKEIAKSFLVLPLIVVFTASVISLSIGYLLIRPLAKESITAFSYPELKSCLKPYMIAFILIAPLLFTLVINGLIIRSKLSQEPLKLLRKQIDNSSFSKADLSGMKFKRRFLVRQVFMEIKTSLALFIGVFLSIVIMVLGFCIRDSIDYYIYETKEKTPFEYMYLFQYPNDNVPAGSEEAYTENMKIDYPVTGRTVDISLLGVKKNSEYFKIDFSKEENEVCVSSSAVEKLGLKINDTIYLANPFTNKCYKFTVVSSTDYANGLYVFMDLDLMRELFEKEDNYYNTCFSMEKLNIENGRLMSTITKTDISSAADLFVEQMFGTELLLILLSIMVLFITMYLLIKLMIERATFSISLMKVLGYQKREISRVYLAPGTVTLIFSTIVSIPLGKLIMTQIFPLIITNFASGLKVYIYPLTYVFIIVLVIASYLVISFILKYHLSKISLTEILKSVE